MKPMQPLALVLALAGLLFSLPLLRADDFPGLKEPLKTVTERYVIIQRDLATDKFDGLPAAAADLKNAIASAPPNTFAPDFAKAANDLAAAKDLHGARVAFQAVSNSFIALLAQDQVETGMLHSAYCPMIKAYWVQTDPKNIHNPYYGTAMPDCGELQRRF